MATHISKSASSATSPSSTCTYPPHLPWLVKLQLRIIPFFFYAFLRRNHTLNRRLVDFFTPKHPLKTLNLHTKDIHIHPNLTFRLFNPNPTKLHQQKLPLLIFFHGGGFFLQTGESNASHIFASNLALRLPAIVASLSYRLSPEHKYPAQHQDAYDMITFLDANPHLLPQNTDLTNTFLIGESAGANIAHFAAAKIGSKLLLNYIKIKGLVSIQPFFGGEERTESELRLFQGPMLPVWVTDWMWGAYLPEGANKDHVGCNVSRMDGEVEELSSGFPRSLVVVGGYDPLQDWQRRYYKWLRELGKDVEVLEIENGIHGFYVFTELDETRMLFEHVGKFVYKPELS